MKKYLIVFILLIQCSCTGSSGSGDAPTNQSAPYVGMYDAKTLLGQKIQSNGYEYNSDEFDSVFLETENCLGYSEIPPDIYIDLRKPYSAFPCISLPERGCGGLFDMSGDQAIISITADLKRLKHEYIHYMLEYSNGNPDSNHETDYFNQCS